MFMVTIQTDNEAFGDDPRYEIAEILHKLARKVSDRGPDDYPLMDSNGNRVGSATWSNE